MKLCQNQMCPKMKTKNVAGWIGFIHVENILDYSCPFTPDSSSPIPCNFVDWICCEHNPNNNNKEVIGEKAKTSKQ